MDSKDLDASTRNRLRAYGYGNADIADLTVERIAEIVVNRIYRPGSTRAARAQSAATGNPVVPHAYTDEGIAEANKGKEPANVYVIRGDYEADLAARAMIRRAGGQAPSPTDEIAQPYVEANPDRAFRWMTEQHTKARGTRGWQPVYDQNGKKITHLNEGRYLAHKPKEVREEILAGYREQNERARIAAREHLVEAGRRAEVDSGGAIRIIPPDQLTRLIEGRNRS